MNLVGRCGFYCEAPGQMLVISFVARDNQFYGVDHLFF
jgi:hypothetical protein